MNMMIHRVTKIQRTVEEKKDENGRIYYTQNFIIHDENGECLDLILFSDDMVHFTTTED